ncbi:hemolysin-type calcium-binding region [Calothrix sp. PCC 7716]|nr:hemolysin-type calcium-binding region [Calothrix sp. PCC 7716]
MENNLPSSLSPSLSVALYEESGALAIGQRLSQAIWGRSSSGNEIVARSEETSNILSNNEENILSSLSLAIYNPGSDVALGQNPSQIILERTGNGILLGYQPIPAIDNPNAPSPRIDILIGDVTIEDFRQWDDTFVLGGWEAPYYANNGLDDLGVILDFNPAQDTIQLFGSANDYQLLNVGFGTAIVYQTPTGGLDPIGFVLGNSLSLDASYFEYRGTTPPPGPVIPQAKQIGTLGFDAPRDVATDVNGNVYVGGTTTGAIKGENFGLLDGFVVKYDSQGNELFRLQIGTSATEEIFGTATDNQGNFYISGLTEGNLGGPLRSQQVDAFVAKYDSSGNQQWIRQVGQNVLFPTFTLAVDANTGDVFITGPDVRASLENVDDAFVIKFDTNGNQLWQEEIGTSGFLNFDESYGITVGKDNGVYVTGWTNSDLAAPNQGLYDNWLARLNNTTGQVEWVSQYGTSDYEWSWSVATDSQNNVYTTGWTLGSLDGENAGSYDAYLTKFDNQGNLQWIKQFGTSSDDEARDLFIDASDNIFITGFTLGDLGGANAGSFDAWVAQFNTNGDQQWITQFGTPDRDDPISITADNQGNLYVVGDTQGSLGSLNAGSFDAWTAKLDAATGNLQDFSGTPENPLPDEPLIFFGDGNDDVVRAGDGNNVIYGNDGNNTISLGNGNNQIYAGSGNDVVNLGNGNNTIYVNDGNNTVKAGNGNNSIYAGSGNDVINTGAGNDLIYANEGNNTITAGAGNNTIYVGSGDDIITTGAGDDLIHAGEGNNIISVGSGNDTVYVGNGANRFILDAGVGALTVYGFTSNDSISLGNSISSSTNLRFTISGSDTLIFAGDDLLATLKFTQLNTVNVV